MLQVAHPVPHTVQRLVAYAGSAKVPSGHWAKHWEPILNRYVRYEAFLKYLHFVHLVELSTH